MLAVIKVSHAHLENRCPRNANFKASKITPKSTRLQSGKDTVRAIHYCNYMIMFLILNYVIFLLFSMSDHVRETHCKEPLIPSTDPVGIQIHQKLMVSNLPTMPYDMTVSYVQAYGCSYDKVAGTTHHTETPHEVVITLDNCLNVLLTIFNMNTYAVWTRQSAVVLILGTFCCNPFHVAIMFHLTRIGHYYATRSLDVCALVVKDYISVTVQ